MNEMTIRLDRNGAAAVPGGQLLLGYAGNRGNYRLRIEQRGEWKGLTVCAHWHTPGASAVTLVENGILTVPAAVTAVPGAGCLTFEGTDGSRTVTSADVRCKVCANSGTAEGTMPAPATPAWEALVGLLGTGGGITTAEKQALLAVLRLLAAGNDAAMNACDRLATLWDNPQPPKENVFAVLGQAILEQMSYVKQNFVDGQTLTAAQLNHMEAGIAATATGVKGDKGEKGDPGPQGPKGDKGDPGEGFTANAKALLLNLFENAAYKTDTMQPTLNALRAEWGGSAQEFPVQSVSLSAVTMTLNESESKTLTATVLPANATDRAVVWSVLPTGFATVANGVVTGIKAGNCTVTATAGGKSASCAVTVEVVETAQLIYSLPGETVLTQGLDTGLKLLEHASTETPQYTILVDAKAGDDFNANTWPAFLHCLTETGDTDNLPGFNSTSSPLNNKTEFAYYNYGGVTLSDSIEHLKTRTRYAVQIDGRKYRGGSTYCPLTEWKTTNGTIIDVPQTFLIGAAQSADGSKKQQFWSGTLYQCRVYKGLLSDDKVNDYIEKGW